MKTEISNHCFVSIIMAAYNAENTIAKSIESVLEQTYSDFELIVVNDCSTDLTRSIVESYLEKDSRIRLINNDVNCGVSTTRHNGLQSARGTFIAILDSDDSWENNKLQRQVELIISQNAKLVYTGVSFIDEYGVKKKWIMHVPTCVNYRSLLYQNMISNSSAIVEKRLYEEFEALEDQIHEDYACWLRILRSGVTAIGIDEPLLEYRVSTKSKSGNKIKSGLMIWRTYRYIGLNYIESIYYLACYMFNGSLKYFKIKHS